MGKQFKMDTSTLLIAFSVIFLFSNIDFGNINLGGIAETALGTTLGNLGTGFLQDCLGIGKRSIIMDRLVNKRSAQEVTSEVTDADSRIISPQDVNERIFCTNNNNGYNGGGGFGGFGGSNRPNCRTCSCYNDNRCYNTCDKCYQGYNNYNTGGFSSNSGGSNFGSSNNNYGSNSYGSSNSGSGYTNSNSCSCTYSSSCRRSCYKCSNSSGGWRRDGAGDSSNSGESSNNSGETITTSDNGGAVNFGNA